MMVRSSKLNLDKLGACASAICAVHCLLTGVALGLLSVTGLGFFGSLWADIAFLTVAVIIGSFAVWHGIRAHHSYIPASVFVMGLFFIVLGHFVFRHSHGTGGAEDPFTHAASVTFSVLGGLSLVAFHTLNLRLQKGGHCGCNACAQRAQSNTKKSA